MAAEKTNDADAKSAPSVPSLFAGRRHHRLGEGVDACGLGRVSAMNMGVKLISTNTGLGLHGCLLERGGAICLRRNSQVGTLPPALWSCRSGDCRGEERNCADCFCFPAPSLSSLSKKAWDN